MTEDFSNEALYRLIEEMGREQGVELREIRRQTTATNGRVSALETRANRNDQELKRLNSAVFNRRATDTETGESVYFRISPKIWVAVAAAGGMLLPHLVEWIRKALETR